MPGTFDPHVANTCAALAAKPQEVLAGIYLFDRFAQAGRVYLHHHAAFGYAVQAVFMQVAHVRVGPEPELLHQVRMGKHVEEAAFRRLAQEIEIAFPQREQIAARVPVEVARVVEAPPVHEVQGPHDVIEGVGIEERVKA